MTTAAVEPAAPSAAVTADHARRRLLEPSMDALALNFRIGRLLHRPSTPEPDSILEILAVLQAATHRVAALAEEVAETAGLQLEPLHEVTGYADRLATALHDAECNGSHPRPLAGRKLAAHLRPLIDAAAGDDRIAAAAAGAELFLLFDRVSEDLLFREACTYQLGARRTDQLRVFYESFTAYRAAEREALDAA